jgi:streptomycin 6-kinase
MAVFRGHGVARVLEHEPGAVLLEELRPGIPLVGLVRANRDVEATEALVGVIDAMVRIVPETAGIRTAAEYGAGFERHMEAGDFGTVSRELASFARDVYSDLCATQGPTRLLHGDLQHFNVLLDSERGWVAIDAKGVVAELEFELSAALRNPDGPSHLFTEKEIRRRIGQFAGGLALDAKRIGAWAFSSAVLSVIWMLEDHDPPLRVTSALEKATAMRFLVS